MALSPLTSDEEVPGTGWGSLVQELFLKLTFPGFFPLVLIFLDFREKCSTLILLARLSLDSGVILARLLFLDLVITPALESSKQTELEL